jgi:hypothetical protein
MGIGIAGVSCRNPPFNSMQSARFVVVRSLTCPMVFTIIQYLRYVGCIENLFSNPRPSHLSPG